MVRENADLARSHSTFSCWMKGSVVDVESSHLLATFIQLEDKEVPRPFGAITVPEEAVRFGGRRVKTAQGEEM